MKPSKRDPDASGSEAQHLDMYEGEDANLRGDALIHSRPAVERPEGGEEVLAVDEMMNNFNIDMSEEDREGDEMSGDDHSSGLQGGEQELNHQDNVDNGLPGERNEDDEREFDRRSRRRAS